MKLLNKGLALSVVGATLLAAPLQAQAEPVQNPGNDNSVQAMKKEASGPVAVSGESATKRVGFIRVKGRTGDLMPSRTPSGKSGAAAKADAYLDKDAANFGARPDELSRRSVKTSSVGWTVTYTQSYRGVPVFGSLLRAQVDRAGDLTSVNGYAAPGLDLSVTPRLTAAQAARRAVAVVKAEPPTGHDGSAASTKGVRAAATDLMIYRTGSTRGATGENILVYVVEVTNRANIRDMVFVDANTDKVVNRYSMVHDALERRVYEQTYSPDALVWQEGDAFPGDLNEDQQNIVNGSGESYWFFANAFGRDSYDGGGAAMETVNNDPRISCPNANWNGTTTNYCNGVTSDDVVAHEWGHAYTEYTHGLIYQWQPGALNESYSDIWGETVDLINGRMDGDEGDITAKRQDGVCSTHSPLPNVLVINSPAAIAKICDAAPAQFGPALTVEGLTGDVVLGLDDTADPGPSTTDACSPLTNAAEVTGKIALVDRGGCAFTVKVKNAQDAGAVGVVVGQNNDGPPSTMGGGDATITIPSLMISKADRERISGALGGAEPVNVTMQLSPEPREDSFRWLMGEDSTAFGGAIRDMWNPTCYGDPAKVSDAEYHCTPDDGGGVHSNSGVPNHAYALTVDGGTSNGVTVTGIGLTKAAAVYFRAMTVYQTPTTDFVDHANALEQSCTDLVGAEINELSTATSDSQVSDQVISAADCETFAQAAEAVELRRDPVQCNFQPMFDKDTPALCGEGTSTEVVWEEDFEDGLAGWGASQEVVYPGASGMPWEAVSGDDVPGDHDSAVAYGPAPDHGQCDGSASDFSSRDSIMTESITFGDGNWMGQKLSFEHYVATETGFDGGNVKYRIGEGKGKWRVIPAAAYVFNAPSQIATAAAGNTNPLAGEPGFTGTDGGIVFGSWGTSIVDLSALGIKGGKPFQLRFDIGRDGCGGLDGWYVDNIKVTHCVTAGAATAGREGRQS